MTTRHELCLEEKINFIKHKETGLSHRILSEKFHNSIVLKTISHIVYVHYKFNRFEMI